MIGWVLLGLLGLLAASGAGGSGAPLVGRPPVPGARLSSRFGIRKHPTLGTIKEHTGIDLAAPIGTPIYAVEGGLVTRIDADGVGKGVVNGNTVHLQAPSGTWAYLHMYAPPHVRVGQVIAAGQQLGIVGTTGRSSGPHLHLSLWRGGVPVDPWPLVGPMYGGAISGDVEPDDFDVCCGEDP